MAEAVHPPVLAAHRDVGFYHICPYQLVKMVPIGKRKERGHMADKDTAAVNLRPPIFQVIDHCPAHIRDKRQFHGLPCFRLGKTEFFLRPVKVFKAQVFNVRAAQTQAARDQDDGIVTSAFRTPPINGPDQLLQFFMGPDRGDGSLLPGFYHGHFCCKVILHDTFLVQETEKGTQGTDMLLHRFVGKTYQCPDISMNRIQGNCIEIIHSLCGQIIHQIRGLLHIMLRSHLGIAFFLTGTPEPAADIHKKRGCQYFLMLEITPKHRMVELEIPNHTDHTDLLCFCLWQSP